MGRGKGKGEHPPLQVQRLWVEYKQEVIHIGTPSEDVDMEGPEQVPRATSAHGDQSRSQKRKWRTQKEKRHEVEQQEDENIERPVPMVSGGEMEAGRVPLKPGEQEYFGADRVSDAFEYKT